MKNLRYYAPGLISVVVGLLFFVFPWLAALLLGGFLVFVGVMFCTLVFQWQKAQAHFNQNMQSGETDFQTDGPPRFSQYSVRVIRQSPLFRDQHF